MLMTLFTDCTVRGKVILISGLKSAWINLHKCDLFLWIACVYHLLAGERMSWNGFWTSKSLLALLTAYIFFMFLLLYPKHPGIITTLFKKLVDLIYPRIWLFLWPHQLDGDSRWNHYIQLGFLQLYILLFFMSLLNVQRILETHKTLEWEALCRC